MRIGNRSSATDRSFNGGIKDVKMWNRVLTSAEITTVYGGGTPKMGLIHHFKLGGDYKDYGEVGVDATNSGTIVKIIDDNIAVAVAAQRVTANDKWLIAEGPGGQVFTAEVEEV